MDETDELIQIANYTTPRIIKVIGVGGGGGNAVSQMYRDNIPEVRYLVANTDKKALDDSPVPDHLQLGPGLGAGGNPEIGCRLAEENVKAIDAVLDAETKMTFITAGMGGGTGTGASPIIARESKRKGILTIGIVTIPFLFEQRIRIDKALEGLEHLQKEVDALLVINNERLREIYSDLSVQDAFRRADETLSTAVRSITEIITMHGHVNLDFRDVCSCLRNGGVAIMSSGIADGENRVTKAIKNALNSPLLNNNDVFRAKRILIAITTSNRDEEALTMSEMGEINQFTDQFSDDIVTKWGLAYNPDMGAKVKITIIASGYGLYNNNDTEPVTTTEPAYDEENEKNKQRRNRFYTNKKEKYRQRPRCYTLTLDDLSNEALISELEDTPTYRRSAETLKRLKELSHNADR